MSKRITGRPHGVQGIALGAAAPWGRWSADLDHPLAAGLQEGDEPGAVAAGALDRPAAAARNLRLSKAEQALVTGRVRTD